MQIPVGTLLRRERDLRAYTNLFEPRPTEITGARRSLIRALARRVREPASLATPVPRTAGLQLVEFEGMAGQFSPLMGHHALVRRELAAMTRPRWRELAEAAPDRFIGLHVRRGDFQRPDAGTDFTVADNMITPIEWFIDTLLAIRMRLGADIPALVTSDGTAEELRPLLALDGVRLVEGGSAISDMLLLSRSSVLLASGSSFSAWASYLGRMPTLSHPGQSLARLFNLTGGNGHFVGEAAPGRLPVELEACLQGST